ncbi:hypothetical protein J1605_006551 [Eschrichtius robustus]|uniref:Uncharacterized protein n=1 Tax=Eschrichtius robustus TaxID=9764 RepID=A0AB34H3W0_ESCRO|nr:hypothetical protein J1605_006551 [Eschrichtius robustus]
MYRGKDRSLQNTVEYLDMPNSKVIPGGFPGGTVVMNLPASAGDMGSSPGLGRSHMPRRNSARAPQLLSLRSRDRKPQLLSPCATTTEPARLEPELRNKRSQCNEKPMHRNQE